MSEEDKETNNTRSNTLTNTEKVNTTISQKNLTTFIKDEIEDFSHDDDDDDCNSEHKRFWVMLFAYLVMEHNVIK